LHKGNAIILYCGLFTAKSPIKTLIFRHFHRNYGQNQNIAFQLLYVYGYIFAPLMLQLHRLTSLVVVTY